VEVIVGDILPQLEGKLFALWKQSERDPDPQARVSSVWSQLGRSAGFIESWTSDLPSREN
jgi:hypothetical protein